MFRILFDNKEAYLDWIDIFISVFIFVFGLWFFSCMYTYQYDMGTHLFYIFNSFEKGNLFKLSYNFLLKFNVILFALFNKELFGHSFVCVLSLSFLLKFIILRIVFIDYLSRNNIHFAHKAICSCLILFLCFASQLFFLPQILGSFSIHLSRLVIYHNPTTIAVTPFAIALFYFSYLFFIHRSLRFLIILFLLLFVNLLIKPSFIFAWAPSYFILMSFFKFNNNDSLSFHFNPINFIIGLLCFSIIGYFLFLIKSSVSTLSAGISFSFPMALNAHMRENQFVKAFNIICESFFGTTFHFKYNWIYNIIYVILYFPMIIIGSILFPIITFILSKNKKSVLFVFAWLCVSFSYFVSFFLIQNKEIYSFNFSWQIPIANLILFLTSLLNILSFYKSNQFYSSLALLTLFIHFYQGFVYLARIAFGGNL